MHQEAAIPDTRSLTRRWRHAGRLEEFAQLLGGLDVSCELVAPDGCTLAVGEQPPAFRVVFKNQRAWTTPLNELALGRAYVEGDIDIEGDMMTLFDIRRSLRDGAAVAQKLRFAVHLFLRSPTWVNSRAIAHHYTHGDDFYLKFIDTRYRFYSHCLFHSDDETLEEAAEHKLENMWSALGLRRGMRVLDIGGGWGGLTDYCGTRGVNVTSLTLIEESARYIRGLIRDKGLDGEVIVEDMLTHRPAEPYDHAVIYGVIEHIPNYRRFCERLWSVLKPGGRLYLDASATTEKYAMSMFTRRYIWQGTHTFLAVQDMIEELLFHGFEILELKRETRDYELTIRHWAERLEANREEIVDRWGDPLYRAFRLYLWGGSHAFKTNRLQAYHLVAERRAEPGPRPGRARRLGHFVLSLR